MLFFHEVILRTGIAEVTGSNPVEALIFFRLLLSSCLNWKIHCDDHSSLSWRVLCVVWVEQNLNPSSPVMNETGYGPSSRYGRLLFDGDERKYEQWEVKFLGYMRLRKLKDSITAADDVEITAAKNEETYAELIQFLDDKSLALVMRDARDDGRKALKIL